MAQTQLQLCSGLIDSSDFYICTDIELFFLRKKVENHSHIISSNTPPPGGSCITLLVRHSKPIFTERPFCRALRLCTTAGLCNFQLEHPRATWAGWACSCRSQHEPTKGKTTTRLHSFLWALKHTLSNKKIKK